MKRCDLSILKVRIYNAFPGMTLYPLKIENRINNTSDLIYFLTENTLLPH